MVSGAGEAALVYGVDELAELAGYLYDAALNPDLWEGALQRMCQSLNGLAMALLLLDITRRHVLFHVSHRQPPGKLPHELLKNTLTASPSETSVTAISLPAYEVSPCDRALRHTFRALLEEREARVWLVAHVWEPCPEDGAGPAAACTKANAVLLARWRAMVPHLHRAVRATQHLQQLERKAAAASTLDAFAWGMVLLDAGGRVLHLNREAEEQLARRDGLLLTPKGLVVCAHRSMQDVLASLIAQAVARPGEEGSTVLPRRGGCTPYLLRLVPVSPGHEPLGNNHPAATLFIRELLLAPTLSATTLCRLFRLTTREAELTICLARGRTVKTCAEQLGITPKTARCHLGAVFRKTGTHRQVDLVGFVRVLAGCPLRPAS